MNLNQYALKQLNLQVGDIVRVKYKVPNTHGGWSSGWVGEMDKFVGRKECRVKSLHSKSVYITNDDLMSSYYFPAFCLEIVKRVDAPVDCSESIHDFALKNLDIKPGDIVKVLFKVPDSDGGWRMIWKYEMSKMIGETFEVKEAEKGYGVKSVTDSFWYPAHCLEVVERAPETEEIVLNEKYKAVVTSYSVKVGCQTIKAETVLEIANAIKRLTK